MASPTAVAAMMATLVLGLAAVAAAGDVEMVFLKSAVAKGAGAYIVPLLQCNVI